MKTLVNILGDDYLADIEMTLESDPAFSWFENTDNSNIVTNIRISMRPKM